LFETPDDGLIEVRVLDYDYLVSSVTVRVSQVSPQPGLAAGFVDLHGGNGPFSPTEIKRIRGSIEQVQKAVRERDDLRAEQSDLIVRKLDEMAEASERVGRRDWINLAVGTITNIVVTAALDSSIAKFLFTTVARAFSWLTGPLKILP
jgi:hypothetical protein